MIYLVLSGGLAGCGLALYARPSDIRFLGGLTAFVAFVIALINWGAW
ncbi:hypothetical protein [Streptomyces sp. NBC_01233]|nr:hypothetical protein OG332_24190 [Streptomyces sp. NBC_01233]